MATEFDFPNLAPYQAAAAQRALEISRINPIEESILRSRESAKVRDEVLSRQLAAEIQRANLEKLQRPEFISVPGVGLVTPDITSPTGVRVVAPAAVDPTKGLIETSAGMLRVGPGGTITNAFPFNQKPVNDPWGNPIATDQGLVQRNEITGQTRRFTLGDTPLLTNKPASLKSPWGDPFPTDQGLMQRNEVTNEMRAAQLTAPVTEGSDKVINLTRTSQKAERLPPTAMQTQYLGAQNLFNTAPRYEAKIAELRAKGIKEPTNLEKSVINLAYQDPQGLISGFATAVATGKIRPEIADLEQMRAEIESNYVTAKAGLSQTASEVKRTIPVAPTRFDSWDRALSKTKNLREVAAINVANTNKLYPNFGKSLGIADQVVDYPTEADIPDNLPVGTTVTVGGRRAIWEGR